MTYFGLKLYVVRQDFDLKFNHSAKTNWKPVQRKLARGEHVEVFSFDLKSLNKLQLRVPLSGVFEPTSSFIYLKPGIYEFTWTNMSTLAVSKPVFFEIK